jgi:hypothetical protein
VTALASRSTHPQPREEIALAYLATTTAARKCSLLPRPRADDGLFEREGPKIEAVTTYLSIVWATQRSATTTSPTCREFGRSSIKFSRSSGQAEAVEPEGVCHGKDIETGVGFEPLDTKPSRRADLWRQGPG